SLFGAFVGDVHVSQQGWHDLRRGRWTGEPRMAHVYRSIRRNSVRPARCTVCASGRDGRGLRDGQLLGQRYCALGLWRAGSLIPRGEGNTFLCGGRPQVCRTAAGDEVYTLWGLGVYSPHMPAFATLPPSDPPGLWSTGQVAPAVPLPDENAADRDALIRVR